MPPCARVAVGYAALCYSRNQTLLPAVSSSIRRVVLMSLPSHLRTRPLLPSDDAMMRLIARPAGYGLLSAYFLDLHIDTNRETCPDPDCGRELSDADILSGWLKNPNEYTTVCPFCRARESAENQAAAYKKLHEGRSVSVRDLGLQPSPACMLPSIPFPFSPSFSPPPRRPSCSCLLYILLSLLSSLPPFPPSLTVGAGQVVILLLQASSSARLCCAAW